MKIFSSRFIWSGILIFLTANISVGQRTSVNLGTENWPPFSYKDEMSHQILGLSSEVITETFKRMKVSISNNKIYPWIWTQKKVYAGIIDAAYTASISDERMKHCYFPSEPVATATWVLFIRKSNKNILKFSGLNDLKGKKIGLIRGYNYPPDFYNYIKENSLIDNAAQETTNITKLLAGRFEYMPAVIKTTLHLAKNSPELKEKNAFKNLYYFPTPLATTDFYLMFSKKVVEKAFVDRFSKALVEFKKTEHYRNILKKYQ